jgi:hypothetical protein
MLMQLSELGFCFALPRSEHEILVDIDISEVQLMEILSYILHPSDETLRSAELSLLWGNLAKSTYSESYLQLETTKNAAVDRAIRTAIREFAVEKFATGHLFSTAEIKKAAEAAGLAAQILATIRGISEAGANGSLNKAVFILDKVGIAGRTRAFKAWRSHKSVAHLKLAISVVAQMGIFDAKGKVEAIMGIAREVQAFATVNGHIPESEIWEVPAGRAYEMTHCRLDDHMLAALREYRAPA